MKGVAYLIQATLVALWWIGMFYDRTFFNAFQFPGISEMAFNAFLLPDVVVICLGSLARAYYKRKYLEYIILGGFSFATLYCINATMLSKGGFLSTTIMMLGLCYNIFLIFQDRLFRVSNTDTFRYNALKTLVQIICIWTITLLVLPAIIARSFDAIRITEGPHVLFGIILFLLCSVLGLYSAFVMVKSGKGTPLPLDQTQKLVTTGPYQFIRNPMAVAGIGQGVAVSILLLSIPIFLYAVLGAMVWHVIVRPVEEKNMSTRFGSDFLEYKKRVGLWIPKWS